MMRIQASHQTGQQREATWTSYSRTSSLRSVDFPEPLGPTTAQLCPGSTLKLTPFSTGLPGWYLRRSRRLHNAWETRSVLSAASGAPGKCWLRQHAAQSLGGSSLTQTQHF